VDCAAWFPQRRFRGLRAHESRLTGTADREVWAVRGDARRKPWHRRRFQQWYILYGVEKENRSLAPQPPVQEWLFCGFVESR
jgi:hypothetical protein